MTTTAFTMAQRLLDLINVSAANVGVVLPERQVLYFSPLPIDCAQVGILVEGWYPNPPLGDVLDQCYAFSWVVKFGVIIARDTCAIPQGKTPRPTVASMTQALQIASDDMEVLRDLVSRIEERGGLEISARPPAGGMQVVELLLTLRADGTL